MTSADFAFIAAFLKERSGLIITPDKMYLLETRLTSILRDNGLKDLPGLVEMLRQPGRSAMKDKVVDAMTTNETSFFRDSHPFDTLRKSILPGLIERRATSRTLRIWSAACSTGQEPYSLAMILKDHFPILGGWKVEIVATDISPSVLERARDGLYSTFEVQRGMPIQMLIRHFDQVDQHWRVKPELRQNIAFRPANLLEDLSILGAFDIVLCRNVLIYFDGATQSSILERMADVLAPEGVLCLGDAEAAPKMLLQALPGGASIFSKLKTTPPRLSAAV